MDTLRRPGRWHDGFGRVATRCAQLLAVLAVVVIVGYLGVTLRLVVVPVLIAVLIAAAASPLVDLLDRRLPRLAAVWITILVGAVVLGGVGFLVGNAVASQFGDLRAGVLEGFQKLSVSIEAGAFGLPATNMDALVAQVEGALQGSAVQAGAVTGATAVAQVATGIVLAIVTLFFLLKDGRIIWRFLRDQLPEREHHRFDLVGARSAVVMGGYVRGTATVASIDAVVIGVGLVVIGVPLALPLALLVFITAFVPVVGAVAAGVVAALIALVSNGPQAAILVVILVLVVNQIEGNFLQPVLMGRYLSLHPLVILLALTAGSIAAGIIGAILAVPFAAVAWAAIQASRQADADTERQEAEIEAAARSAPPPGPGPDPRSDDGPAPGPGAVSPSLGERAGTTVRDLLARARPQG